MRKIYLMLLCAVCVSFVCCGDDKTIEPTPTPTPTPTLRDVQFVTAINDSVFEYLDLKYELVHKGGVKNDTVIFTPSELTIVNDPYNDKNTIKMVWGDTFFKFYGYTFKDVPVGHVLVFSKIYGTVKTNRPKTKYYDYLCDYRWPLLNRQITPYRGLKNDSTEMVSFIEFLNSSTFGSYTVQ